MADTTRMIGRKATNSDIIKNIKKTKNKDLGLVTKMPAQNKKFGQKLTPVKIKKK